MFNKPWSADILTTTPFTSGDEDNKVLGMTITARICSSKSELLSDLFISKKNLETVNDVISKPNPFTGEIQLVYNTKSDLAFQLMDGKSVKCELAEVYIEPQKVDNEYVVRAKIKFPKVTSQFAGEVVSYLHNEATITLTTKQQDMFDENQPATETAVKEKTTPKKKKK